MTGYNPSHLAGGGDILETLTQAFNSPISDYDLKTILMQIYPEVTTQKILLVGHSQGAFYTNEMYDYLTSHGVPRSAIAVYEIATPASAVAGGGGYVTSTNDKVINSLRDDEVGANVGTYLNSYYTVGGVIASTLRANITVPKESDWETDKYGGHGLDVYLGGAAPRIVADMNVELGNLSASDATSSQDGCFIPPSEDLSYKTQSLLLSAADPIATGAAAATGGIVNGGLALAQGVSGALASAGSAIQNGLSFFGFGSTPAGQAAAAALPLESTQQIGELVPSLPAAAENAAAPQTQGSVPQTQPTSQNPQPNIAPPTATAAITPSQSNPPPIGNTPGFGGGGGTISAVSEDASIQNDSASTTQEQAPTEDQSQSQDQDATTTISLTVTVPEDGALFATSSVKFSGTATAGATVLANATGAATVATTTIVNPNGDWALGLTLAEGSTSVALSAADTSGNSSATSTRDIAVDLTPPATPIISIPACDKSLVDSGCLVATTTVAVQWSAADGASYYALARNGILGATTTATSASVGLVSGATTTLSVVAYDAAGNAATSSTLEVAAFVQPIIINEIAWGGDDVSASDQWIELQNLSPSAIDLSHVVLTRSGGDSIQLSGTIPASGMGQKNNFIVIEPHDIADTGTNKAITSFAPLSTTTAEELSLVWSDGTATTTLDATPAVSACSGWCAGSLLAKLGRNESGVNDLFSPLSMERKANTADGTLATSWQNTDSYGPWLNAGPTVGLSGSPDAQNSLGLPDAGIYCSPSVILVSSAPPGPLFDPGTGCTYLSKFITGNTFGAVRFGGLYEGDVGSSTDISGHSMGKALALSTSDTVPAGTPAGTHFFFAIWEQRSFANNDTTIFNTYFMNGASSTLGISGPPHGNYVVLPFTYAP